MVRTSRHATGATTKQDERWRVNGINRFLQSLSASLGHLEPAETLQFDAEQMDSSEV